MLLRSIVEQLDAELNRLHAIRRIVADLKRTPPLLQKLITPMALVSEPKGEPPTVPTEPQPTRRRGRPRGSKNKRSAPSTKDVVPTPLQHAVPRGPVVMSPSQLAQERAHRLSAREQAVEAARKPEAAAQGTQDPQDIRDIEGESRALLSRWVPGSLAS